MVKALDVDAGYSPSKRADTWLKVDAVHKYFVNYITLDNTLQFDYCSLCRSRGTTLKD